MPQECVEHKYLSYMYICEPTIGGRPDVQALDEFLAILDLDVVLDRPVNKLALIPAVMSQDTVDAQRIAASIFVLFPGPHPRRWFTSTTQNIILLTTP
jgi:hypothetical protein